MWKTWTTYNYLWKHNWPVLSTSLLLSINKSIKPYHFEVGNLWKRWHKSENSWIILKRICRFYPKYHSPTHTQRERKSHFLICCPQLYTFLKPLGDCFTIYLTRHVKTCAVLSAFILSFFVDLLIYIFFPIKNSKIFLQAIQ